MKKSFAVVAMLMFSSFSYAGSKYTGTIKVHCNVGHGHCNVRLNGPAENVPSCASNPDWYVFDVNNPIWKEQFSIALSAQVANRKVIIGGTGSCDIRPGVHETLGYITLE